jgi:hypothetical protein
VSRQLKLIYYDVIGAGQFPVDMLRYDSAFPANSNAVTAISRAICQATFADPKIEVRLGSHKRPTIARWRSFGWRVLE